MNASSRIRVIAYIFFTDGTAVARYGTDEIRHYADMAAMAVDFFQYMGYGSMSDLKGTAADAYDFKKLWQSGRSDIMRFSLNDIMNIKKRGWRVYGDIYDHARVFLDELKRYFEM